MALQRLPLLCQLLRRVNGHCRVCLCSVNATEESMALQSLTLICQWQRRVNGTAELDSAVSMSRPMWRQWPREVFFTCKYLREIETIWMSEFLTLILSPLILPSAQCLLLQYNNLWPQSTVGKEGSLLQCYITPYTVHIIPYLLLSNLSTNPCLGYKM